MLYYRSHIMRAMLQAERDVLFVFGDNLARRGFGGQAKEMRGEPNAVGIPTKAAPGMKDGDFLADSDWDFWASKAGNDFGRLLIHPGNIVWPTAGIGTGLAQLPQRAPRIWATIEKLRLGLDNFHMPADSR